MSACTDTNCGGTIEDGYCTVCGLAAAPVQAPVPGPMSAGPGSAVIMSACASCGGTIEDGYCTVCGLAAAPVQAPATGSASAGPGSAAGGGLTGRRHRAGRHRTGRR